MTEHLENLRNFNYYPLKSNPNVTLAEYIFIDGTGNKTRGKTRVN
jgi:glutamine synthetase